ncbi:MAG: PilZ domain-containing protein [Planctomycetes bacterium]|nr:PilZ domain-containing protein [Planctomycetota bacterium]
MDATEICPLTEEAIARLLTGRNIDATEPSTNGRRQSARWPFPGPVELWVPDEAGIDQHEMGTCLNLSLHGLGMLYDDPLDVGQELAIAVHQPEASFHGRAVVRHCTRNEAGYYIGMQFLFDET